MAVNQSNLSKCSWLVLGVIFQLYSHLHFPYRKLLCDKLHTSMYKSQETPMNHIPPYYESESKFWPTKSYDSLSFRFSNNSSVFLNHIVSKKTSVNILWKLECSEWVVWPIGQDFVSIFVTQQEWILVYAGKLREMKAQGLKSRQIPNEYLKHAQIFQHIKARC